MLECSLASGELFFLSRIIHTKTWTGITGLSILGQFFGAGRKHTFPRTSPDGSMMLI